MSDLVHLVTQRLFIHLTSLCAPIGNAFHRLAHVGSAEQYVCVCWTARSASNTPPPHLPHIPSPSSHLHRSVMSHLLYTLPPPAAPDTRQPSQTDRRGL